ncbi:MAG: hypothetical protein H6736_18255 [Alphaproteobacteria bacterium]|nr:hypothetical protein [Alphaproteobacteria bacterium]
MRTAVAGFLGLQLGMFAVLGLGVAWVLVTSDPAAVEAWWTVPPRGSRCRPTTPPPVPGWVCVAIARRDLPAGTEIREDDLVSRWTHEHYVHPTIRPDGAPGATLSGAVFEGEMVRAERLR